MAHMHFNDYGREMASYNSWQNRTLYALCDQIGDEARKQDRNLFFRSILGTLNHILYVDQRILTILKQATPPPFEPRTIVTEDFPTLTRLRFAADADIEAFAQQRDQRWQDGTRALPGPDGQLRHLPLQLFFIQLFNHQTHHRAQITSELHRMGYDYGGTDLPLSPFATTVSDPT